MAFPAELSWAHPVTAEWFVTKFGTPTEPQVCGWPSILAGEANADLRAHRFGENPRCVPGLHRQAAASVHRGIAAASDAGGVCVAAQGAVERHTEKPRRPARARFSSWRCERGYLVHGDSHRRAHRRHPAQRARGDAAGILRTSWSRRRSRSTFCSPRARAANTCAMCTR